MKKVLLLAACAMVALTARSQSFSHGAGVGLYIGQSKGADPTANFALTWQPRINLMEGESGSLSLNLPLTAGFSGSYGGTYNSRTGWEDGSGSGSVSYMLHAPLLLNLNFGAGSSRDNESRLGAFVGGGYGWYNGSVTTLVVDEEYGDYMESNSISTFGPAANAGMRIGVGNSGRNIEVRLSYFRGTKEPGLNLFGAGALFNF
ncbi:hypothetical protein ACWKWU_05515 [Chitinophaga lutea]